MEIEGRSHEVHEGGLYNELVAESKRLIDEHIQEVIAERKLLGMDLPSGFQDIERVRRDMHKVKMLALICERIEKIEDRIFNSEKPN